MTAYDPNDPRQDPTDAAVELTCDGMNWWVTTEYNGTVI